MPIPFLSRTGLPDLSARLEADEWMDDFSVSDAHLANALRDLRWVNRILGGYRTTNRILDPLLRRHDRLTLVDVGCGGGDYLVHLLRRGQQLGCTLHLTGIDANPVTVGQARAHLDHALLPRLRSQVQVKVGDARSLPFEAGEVDIVHAALFLHHFHGDAVVRVLSEMSRVAGRGLLVNDLHRHQLAYIGIWTLSRVAGLAPMVQHDGPLSVRRGFRRTELRALARAARLPPPTIQWHWAFRWTLSTIDRPNG